jgi:hypothetical protein
MQNHIWQVEVSGNIYETDFAGLTQWIAESSLLPQDKIRRGDMPWIEARLVPALAPYFSGQPPMTSDNVATTGQNYQPAGIEGQLNATVNQAVTANFGATMPAPSIDVASFHQTAVTENAVPETTPQIAVEEAPKIAPEPASEYAPETLKASKNCLLHQLREAQFACRQCLSLFCEECPRSIAKVRICPKCGDMCSPIAAPSAANGQPGKKFTSTNSLSSWNQKTEIYVDPNFTFNDFGAAWSYPFKFPLALIIGGVVNALLSVGMYLGFVTTAFGGFFPGIMAILVCGVVSIAMVYGCATRAVNHVAYGRTGESFMLDTEDFSIWDTILQPCFLGIATCLVSFGPMILIGLLIFKVGAGAVTEINKQSETLKDQQQKQLAQLAQVTPPANSANPRDPLEAQIEGASRQSETNAIQRIQELSKTANNSQVPGVSGMSAPKSPDQMKSEMVESVMKKIGPRLIPLILLLGLTFLWGVFYFPTALAVAGYTESVGATLNPLVGFGMARQMGGNFFKAFGSYLILLILGFVIYMGVGLVSMLVGQTLGQFLANIVSFYLYIVIGALFGFALYRSHEKIGFSVAA